MSMAPATQRSLQRISLLLGIGLIGTTLSGCGTSWRERVGLEKPPATEPCRKSVMGRVQPHCNRART